MKTRKDIGYRTLMMAMATVVVIGGLKAAGSVLQPILVAAFIAMLSIPPTTWLQKRKVPSFLAVLLVFLAVLVGFVGISIFVGASIKDFTANLPLYQVKLQNQADSLIPLIEKAGFEVSYSTVLGQLDAAWIVSWLRNALGALSNVLSNTVFVLITMIFILAEATSFPKKIRIVLDNPEADLARFKKVLDDLQGYIVIKSFVSTITGLLAWAVLSIIGVDYAPLWGLLAFMLNYIPTLGSIIAAVPPAGLAFIQFGWKQTLAVVIAFVVINLTMGSFLEPKLMGRRLGLSTLVVFLSLVFWGWIWGPVGMVLCVPLTMILKILLENSDDMRWLGVLLGSSTETDYHGSVAFKEE